MTSRYFRHLAYKTLFFFIVWIVLSETFDRFHMSLGLASALAVAWLNTDRDPVRAGLPPLRVIWYVPWLIVQIVKSGVHLSRLILSPSLPIAPEIVRYQTGLEDEAGIVLLANSITLTPGTITLEVQGKELMVHAIDAEAAAEVADQQFEIRIGEMIRKSGEQT